RRRGRGGDLGGVGGVGGVVADRRGGVGGVRRRGGGEGRRHAVRPRALDRGERPAGGRQAVLAQGGPQVVVEGGDAVVVEPGGDRAEHRQVLQRRAERLAVALQLAAHVPQGVGRAGPVELVDRHDVGEVEHVDL